MGQSWASLYFAGLKLTDEQYEDIPYPRSELTYHVTEKCFQAGCIIGTLSGIVTSLASSQNRNLAGLVSKVTRHGTRGALVGICVGPLMTYGRMRNLETDAIVDRCYRLRHNKCQVRVDQASSVGFVAGPIVAKFFGYPLLFGMVLGVSGNVLGMAVRNAQGPPAKI